MDVLLREITLKALVDIDSMIIAAGALGENVYYEIDGYRFDYIKEAKAYCEKEVRPPADIVRGVDALPVSHAINILKQTYRASVEAAGCVEDECYLSPTDKSNYRFKIYPEYKANRKNVVKPVHFEALRAFAIRHMGAVVCTGMEADDMLCIRAHEIGLDEVVIISVDKDMKQVPCRHYDWRKKSPILHVTPWEGWCLFYTQLLTGDTVDNIKGCPKIGPAKAAAALKDCTTEEQLLDTCLQLYIKQYDGDTKEGTEMMAVNAQLLRLLETRQ